MDFDSLRQKLNGRVNGSEHKFVAKCPAHDDQKESLSVSLEGDKLLMHCFAGCSFADISTAIGFTQPKNPAPEPELVHTYDYLTAHGSLALQVLRYTPKSFRQRIPNPAGGWTWGTKGAPKVLYNLPNIITARGSGIRVIVCEGEKDADTASSLGFVGTTNPSGSSKWVGEYTEQLRGCNVVIAEDNDDAGRKRTARLIDSLSPVAKSIAVVRFPDEPEKSDISDFFAKYGSEKTIAKIENAETVNLREEYSEETVKRPPGMKGRKEACYLDYVNFVKSLPGFGDMRRELFSDDLLIPQKHGIWVPVANFRNYFEGCAIDYGKFFKPVKFMPALERYRLTLEPDLCVEIPPWDQEDRLLQMADKFKFNNVSPEVWYDLMREWGSVMFQRIEDPYIQPTTPIYVGPQGCGKDSLINTLCGGMGLYFKNLDIRSNRADEAIKQLHSGIVFNISEFDRTSRTEVATLKHLLTTATTDTRLAYDARDQKRIVRASFIASANIIDVLADGTGNRRYWVFDCEFLGYPVKDIGGKKMGGREPTYIYPGHSRDPNKKYNRLQLLAQFKHLAELGFSAPPTSRETMEDYIRSIEPDDIGDEIVAEYMNKMADAIREGRLIPDEEGRVSVKEASPIFNELAREFGKSRNSISRIIGSRGLKTRTRNMKMVYTSLGPRIEDQGSERSEQYQDAEVLDFI